MKITLNDISTYKTGLIRDLLKRSYRGIPTTTENDRNDFNQFDKDVSEHSQWIGQYVFFTTVDGKPVGFVSFDPRQKPIAIIGHNCVVPAWRGKGIGEQQLMFALQEMKKQGFTSALVSTCGNEYFVPAQRMYQSCGFKETRRFTNEKNDVPMIEYQRPLPMLPKP